MILSSRILFPTVALAALTLGVSSCNLFDPLDSPSGDAQVLSAARACLDRGDYACAMDYYEKLSADQNDVKLSEEAYSILDQNGAGFKEFAASFGSGGTGPSLTKFSEKLTSGAGEAKRLAIYAAYKKVSSMNAGELKELTRFLTATALASEMLAETAGGDGALSRADLATSASCFNANSTSCASTANCDAPASARFPKWSTGMAQDLASDPTGTYPNTDLVYSAIKEALTGLDALSAGGGFGSTSGLLTALTAGGLPSGADALDVVNHAAGSRCFRFELIKQQVGE